MKTFVSVIGVSAVLVAVLTGAPALATIRAMGAGGGSSGGGDNVGEDADAAWFLGSQRTIQACVDMAPEFGVSLDEAKEDIESAFYNWRRYMAEKIPGRDLDLATHVSFNSQCNGTEDLTFFLGTTNEQVRLVKAKYTNPTGFSFRQRYDSRIGWGSGWIWIAPQGSVLPKEDFPHWTKPPNTISSSINASLESMLTHEIGHVLGVPHVEGTIMSENISEYLKLSRNSGALPYIDQARELILCWECSYSKNGSLGDRTDDSFNAKEIFKILTGTTQSDLSSSAVEFRGDSAQILLRLTNWPNDSDAPLGEWVVPISFPTDSGSQDNRTRIVEPQHIFKRMFRTGSDNFIPPMGAAYLSERLVGEVSYGTMRVATGEIVPIILERNLLPESGWNYSMPFPTFILGDAAFRIKMIYQGKVRTFFRGSWLKIQNVNP